MGSVNAIAKVNEKVNLLVKNETTSFPITGALIINNLQLPAQRLSKEIAEYCQIKTGIMVESYDTIPDLLIGQDNCDLIITREFHVIIEKTLLISRCSLGWAIHGNLNFKLDMGYVNLIRESVRSKPKSYDESLERLVKAYLDFNAPEVKYKKYCKSEDARALKILESTSRFCGEFWEVGLPWKDDNTYLPDSRPVALRRLQQVEKKLDRDIEYANLYYKEMNRLIELGYAKKVKREKNGTRVWYLPHFGVKNVNKPGKLRLVFDAAAKTAGKSFNDLLLTGPDLLKSLLGVLMRHREFYYAVKGDYKDMYLVIKIRKEDQDAQRFLYRGSDRSRPPDEFIIERVFFGGNAAPTTAMFIKNANAERYRKVYPDTVKSIHNNCYVDDYLESCVSIEEVRERVEQVIEINASAGWRMHGWASNEISVLENINTDSGPCQLIRADSEAYGGEKLLGLRWFCSLDKLAFNIQTSKIASKILSGNEKPTKREFLAIIMSVFDPLGFLIPFTIKSRILMQDIWSSGIGWDEQLRDAEFKRWRQWLFELDEIKSVRINRCYQLKDAQVREAELHNFCDASTKAFAAVAYWRFILPNKYYHVAFIMAKGRVAPLKLTTIPRLELQAAVLAIQIAKTIIEEHRLKIIRRVFWSDSQTVLHWIKKDPREFKIYVANRLTEIHENSENLEWRWVPTGENPADDGTRASRDALKSNSRWLKGPAFLHRPDYNWPVLEIRDFKVNETSNTEMKCDTVLYITLDIPFEIDFSRFSSWARLKTVIKRAISIIDIWKNRTKLVRKENKDARTPAEQNLLAERICLKLSQKESFETEILNLKQGRSVPRDSRLITLNPYLDNDGVLRSESRITGFENSNENTRPLILDSKNTAVQLLIKEFHTKFYHANHETVINEIRQKYWIIGLRRGLRSLVAKCFVCKMLRATPSRPKMAILPAARLAYRQRPFTHTGLDYFGPIDIKIGRRTEKRWGALFTCLTTRAIHLELAHIFDH